MPQKFNGNSPAETGLRCPDCDKEMVDKRDIHSFRYGAGDSAIDISVEVPMKHCAECELSFLEAEGQELAHEALCRRLAVLSPRQIREIRSKFRMSREEFATTTGLGEATLGRWERGEGIQSQANDLYLRILQQPSGSACLFNILDSLHREKSSRTHSSTSEPRFRVLEVNSKVKSEQRGFELCPDLNVAP